MQCKYEECGKDCVAPLLQGDSGGSLNMRQAGAENKWTQVGVASFVSSNGCESGDPHGFTRVAYFGQVCTLYADIYQMLFFSGSNLRLDLR